MGGFLTANLFFVATLFMLLFQVEARLVSYVYTFHDGVILIESILLGGGLFLLARNDVFWRRFVDAMLLAWCLPLMIAGAFFTHLLIFFYAESFVLTLLSLAVLFGLLFVAIAQYINLAAHRFYGTELLGSAMGVALYVLGVTFMLDEALLILLGCALMFWALGAAWNVRTRPVLALSMTVIVLFAAALLPLSQTALPQLIHCDTYKAPCGDDVGGGAPDGSLSHLKGRTDLYLATGQGGVRTLTARNAGLHSGTTVHVDDIGGLLANPFDAEVPAFDYRPESKALVLGAATGANIQSLQMYTERPDISAVEIDRTVEDIYADERFVEYLPDAGSYRWEYGEARSYIERAGEQYDIVVAGVETVNTDRGAYVDESSSLVYSREALATYRTHIAPEGYLLLVQYAPASEAGKAMTVKLLETLSAALELPQSELSQRVLVYSSAFSQSPGSQRFVTVAYKEGTYTTEDMRVFEKWMDAVTSFERYGTTNPHLITPLHIPTNPVIPAVTYTPFFSDIERTAIAAAYDTSPVTDERPFRHKVTTLPFPPSSYAFFGLFTALFLMVLGRVTETQVVPARPLALAAAFGVATFGLQYLLFYKTAAFLHTSLIFFSVFLIIPLFFSALGGFLSTRLSARHLTLATILAALAAILLATLDIFAQPFLLIFLLIALLFVYAGFLFPLLIHPHADPRTRSILYAVNLFAGGLAFLLLTTLHATLGWTPTFVLTAVVVGGGVVIVDRYAPRT